MGTAAPSKPCVATPAPASALPLPYTVSCLFCQLLPVVGNVCTCCKPLDYIASQKPKGAPPQADTQSSGRLAV